MKIGEHMKKKITKINSDLNPSNLMHSTKIIIFFILTILLLVVLLFRIGYLQFIQGNYLKGLAYQQQAINQIISPKRGNIYDSTGKALAISAQVDTITINPLKLKPNSKDEKAITKYKEDIAKALSDIFELEYDEILKKVNSSSNVETIVKKVEQEKVEKLKNWMKENNISIGINIDEDTKRYYPYNAVASNLIGVAGNDNQGLSGLEASWDSVLTGTPGKLVSSKGSDKKEIPNTAQTYIAAENGSDLNLTIDLNIQTIVEKYLQQAVDNNNCTRGGNAIVMDPKTGDILAMASYPNYNLNSPYEANSTLAESFKNESLFKMWSNKSVSETYEPGSTFKVITSAIALEENITTTDKAGDFYCKGYEEFDDVNDKKIKINCWSTTPHYSQTLRKALCNSCNPAFMQLGARIGAPTLYKYYNALGLFDTTNSGIAGEQTSIFHKLNTVGSVELATMSFGQRLNVTPLQMITAISAIANDGNLMQPRIVKSFTNTDTGVVTEVPTVKVRQVISKSTSEQVRSLMESVVTDGSGRHAAVTGYSIGGKTGTSEPTDANKSEGYVASYVAISPVENTQLVLLLTLYNPDPENKINGHQGGLIAGPVVSQMLSEILPYLNIPSDSNNDTNDSNDLITLPNIKNKTVAEAEKVLESSGFSNINIICSDDKNTALVGEQVPKPGSKLQDSAIIMVYSTSDTTRTSVEVPDLQGLSASEATKVLKEKKLNISIEGSGTVISQDYSKGTNVEEGTIISVTLKQKLTSVH
ncbi:MAG: PASTA domain-containing protein [Clostridia bacterium]|nr:PASTA domain-containing protein [Clostridia bacterium]